MAGHCWAQRVPVAENVALELLLVDTLSFAVVHGRNRQSDKDDAPGQLEPDPGPQEALIWQAPSATKLVSTSTILVTVVLRRL